MKKRLACAKYLAVSLIMSVSAGAFANEVDQRIETYKAGTKQGATEPAEKETKKSSAPETGAQAKKHKVKKESGKEKVAAHHSEKKEGAHHGGSSGMTPAMALNKLLEGNERYQAERISGPNRSAKRRAEVFKGQHPFAVIVGCSDSRVPPEILFDQGIGDLFVVRTAGNVVDSVALGSIEYAVEHLGTNLVVVLGHEKCGAVAATVGGGDAPPNIKTIVDMIRPAVDKAKAKSAGGGGHGHECDLVCSSVKGNVKLIAEKVRTDPTLKEMVEDGMLKVVGGYYELQSGAVTLTYRPDL